MNLAFFDTNVLVYADDASVPEKQETSIRIFTAHVRLRTAVVSLQVMQEYFVVATRKLGVTAELAQRKVELLGQGKVVRPDTSDVIAAIELHRLHRISFWDALIIRSVQQCGAKVLYSEDLQAGSMLGGVRVVNPFVVKGVDSSGIVGDSRPWT